MTNSIEIFQTVQKLIESDQASEALSNMSHYFEAENRWHELFELRKIQLRFQMGLPLLSTDSTSHLPTDKRTSYEEGLINACREIGTALVKENRLREAWVYLQAVDDQQYVKDLIVNTKIDDENADELIELAINEAVAPIEGFQWLLDRMGTCNAITTYDSFFLMFPLSIRREAAEKLVRHLYQELKVNLVSHIQQHQPDADVEGSISTLVENRPWVFSDGMRHIDESHLAATVRIARIIKASDTIEFARDLSEYGGQMASDYSSQGDPPFENLYEDSLLFFDALSGNRIDEAKSHFGNLAKTCNINESTSAAVEWYIYLLEQTGLRQEAIKATIDLLPDGIPQMNIAPNFFELAKTEDEKAQITSFFREKQRLLDFGISLLEMNSKN